MTFSINGKVAIITGGASGLGYGYALELLAKGAKGVTLIDINPKGNEAILDIERKFGKGKAIFVEADVTKIEQFEDAFKKTIEAFQNIDILINNAGICNDKMWQKLIDVNVNGTIHGILLALEKYLPKYKSGQEGVILNISSIAGMMPFSSMPLYAATKFAVFGMTLSFGSHDHYDKTKIRVVGVAPGSTDTPLVYNLPDMTFGERYKKLMKRDLELLVSQTVEQIVPHVMTIIEKAPTGTMWIVENGEVPFQYQLPDRRNMKKNTLNK